MKNSKAEEIRLRYLYRDLILRGNTRLPFDAARKIIGPDCAYHLYSSFKISNENKFQKKS
jgi:hypothetical protein